MRPPDLSVVDTAIHFYYTVKQRKRKAFSAKKAKFSWQNQKESVSSMLF